MRWNSALKTFVLLSLYGAIVGDPKRDPQKVGVPYIKDPRRYPTHRNQEQRSMEYYGVWKLLLPWQVPASTSPAWPAPYRIFLQRRGCMGTRKCGSQGSPEFRVAFCVFRRWPTRSSPLTVPQAPRSSCSRRARKKWRVTGYAGIGPLLGGVLRK